QRGGRHRPENVDDGDAKTRSQNTGQAAAPVPHRGRHPGRRGPPRPGLGPLGSRMDRATAGQPQVVVVMPAYNAARTLVSTWGDIPHDVVDEVLLVDDGSQDATLEV